MYESIDDLNAILGVEAESVALEFKDGGKLQTFDERAKKELVTDVTAFANSGGGVVIYGIREEDRGGRSVAAALAPVTNPTVTQDRLRETIFSNTDPAFRDFEIKTIAMPGGSAFVIVVEEGDTAYQNRLDRRYYGRVDASSAPMYGFAIRDVMNRRTAPKVTVQLLVCRDVVRQDEHRYTIVPRLTNDGLLTANHWTLVVGLPAVLAVPGQDPHLTIRHTGEQRIGGHALQLFQFSSERQPPMSSGRLLPGEERELRMGAGYGLLNVWIVDELQVRQIRAAPPLHWSLFVDNAPRCDGEVRYHDWSQW
jgi:hypothetical protein